MNALPAEPERIGVDFPAMRSGSLLLAFVALSAFAEAVAPVRGEHGPAVVCAEAFYGHAETADDAAEEEAFAPSATRRGNVRVQPAAADLVAVCTGAVAVIDPLPEA